VGREKRGCGSLNYKGISFKLHEQGEFYRNNASASGQCRKFARQISFWKQNVCNPTRIPGSSGNPR